MEVLLSGACKLAARLYFVHEVCQISHAAVPVFLGLFIMCEVAQKDELQAVPAVFHLFVSLQDLNSLAGNCCLPSQGTYMAFFSCVSMGLLRYAAPPRFQVLSVRLSAPPVHKCCISLLDTECTACLSYSTEAFVLHSCSNLVKSYSRLSAAGLPSANALSLT